MYDVCVSAREGDSALGVEGQRARVKAARPPVSLRREAQLAARCRTPALPSPPSARI